MNPEQQRFIQKTREHHNNQEWHQAIKGYIALLSVHPNNAQFWHELGLAYVQTDGIQDALDSITKAHALSPNDPQILNNLGNAQQLNALWEDAEKSYSIALKIQPDYAEAWHNLARLYHKQKRVNPAIHAWKNALHLQPDYHDAHFSLGLLFLQENLWEEAGIQFKNALELNPDNRNAEFYCGVIALSQDKLEEAKRYFTSVLNDHSEHIESLVNMGVVLLKEERGQAAIEYFSKALACNNHHTEARNNLAATFMHFDRYENALQHYSVLLEEDPQNTEYLYNCGVAQMALGHLSEAQRCFDHLLRQIPTHFSSLNNLAAIAIRLEQRDKAVDLLKRALVANPGDTISQHMLSALQGHHQDQKTCPEYARNLFDNYALYYDKHLKETLSYQLPEQILQLLQKNDIFKVENTLDLGCGSGLTGLLLREMSEVLDGVDISSKMLAQARSKDIYDRLTENEIEQYLSKNAAQFSLIVAADVLPYFGSLSSLLALMVQRLKRHGFIIISYEKNDHTSWHLQENGRFSHEVHYVHSLVQRCGLDIVERQTVNGRTQEHQPIMMELLLLKKKTKPCSSNALQTHADAS